MAKFKAVYSFTAVQPGDLSFQANDIIYVLERPENGWWLGRDKDGQQGVFPFNRVAPAEDVDDVDDRLLNSFVKKPIENDEAVERIERLLVKVEEPVAKYAQKFIVTIHLLTGGVVEGKKEMRDFRVLNEAMNIVNKTEQKILGLDRTERINSSIPEWADNIALPKLFLAPKMRDRASILSDWANKKAGKSEAVDTLFVQWLDPTTDLKTHEGLKKDAETNLVQAEKNVNSVVVEEPQIAVTLFKWHKKDEQDISLEKNEHLAIWENSEFDGWWIGEKVNGDKGLLPSSYVKKLTPEEQADFLHPEESGKKSARQSSRRGGDSSGNQQFDTVFGIGTVTDQNQYEQKKSLSGVFSKPNMGTNQKPRHRQKIAKYRLCSTTAFDELLHDGITIEENGKYVKLETKDRDTPKDGDAVTIYYNGYIWEPQKQELLEFSSSDKLIASNNPNVRDGPLVFKLGGNRAIDGIEEAAKKMTVGQTIRVTLSPDMAYGEVGLPPDIPGNSFLVYDLTLQNIKRGVSGGTPGFSSAGAEKSHIMKRETSFRGVLPGTQSMRRLTQRKKSAAGPDAHKWKRKLSHAQLQKIVAEKDFEKYSIDPEIIEEYLTDEDFIKVFKFDRSNWFLLPAFKRNELKRKAGLL